MDANRILNFIISIAVFGLVFSVWCICLFVWLTQYLFHVKKLQKRLGLAGKDDDESKMLRLWRDIQQEPERTEQEEKTTIQERLRRVSRDAGWQTTFQTVLLGVAGAATLTFVLALVFTNSAIIAGGISLAVVVIFWIYTQNRINRRTALFEKQLVDALGVASRSLRAGHPLTGAFQLISEEIDEPLKNVFYRIYQEQSLGLDLKDSMRKIARQTGNSELRLFATSVAIQLHSGGNMAELMDTLAEVMRARMRLNRRVRVLTAQTQLSAKILIALPIFLFFFINVISPEYMETLYTTTPGKIMLTIMICSMTVGWMVMKRLAVLKY